jgi:ABC-type nitrate/sulfonate/bicarbonate transport system substrate-binding protein
MTNLELDDDEKDALVELLRAQTKNTRWRAQHTKAVRAILAKLEPPPSWPVPYRDP